MLCWQFLILQTSGDPAASPSSSVASANSQDAGQRSNTGAVIGGVVGGIVGLILLTMFAFCFLRLRRAAKMDETRSDLKVVVGDENQSKQRPLSQFSWNPQRSWLGTRPMSTVSGASGPGIAGVGAHR